MNWRGPEPLYGHAEPVGSVAKETFEHCCSASVCSSAMSGSPVACPALSLQPSMPVTSFRNNEVVPTMAIESLHAVAIPFLASSGESFESASLTTTLRQASPPFAFR